MSVTLQPITSANWVACIGLETTEEQQRHSFVSLNVFSLAQAYSEPWWTPLAVYANEIMVGFVMYGRWPDTPLEPMWGVREPGEHHVLRLMIDRRYQGRGYGRAAMEALIEQVKAQPGARAIEVNYDLENTVAAHLYTQLGFQPTRQMDDGEIRARLELDVIK
jgi:diamine N-acetyltransferase